MSINSLARQVERIEQLVAELRHENEEKTKALIDARMLIKGDLVGLEWKKACVAFLVKADRLLSGERT